MAVESYKKWIVVSILLGIAAIIVIAYIKSGSNIQKTSVTATKQSVVPPGPMIDSNINRQFTVDQSNIDMNDPVALAKLGDRYFESNNFSKAIEFYKKAIEKNPKDFDTYNDLGLAYHYTGKPGIAIEKLKKATDIMPSFQRGWLSLGFVLVKAGRTDEALTALQKSIDLAPDTEAGQEAKRILGEINK